MYCVRDSKAIIYVWDTAVREEGGLCDQMMNDGNSEQIKQIRHCNANDKLSYLVPAIKQIKQIKH